MKRLYLVTLLMTISAILFSQNSSYYWYKGKKIKLENIDTKKFLIFESESEDSLNVISLFSENDIKVRNMNPKYIGGTKSMKWTVVDRTTYENLIYKNLKIRYEGAFYKSTRNIDIGLSHIFYVKLKKEQDIYVLDSLSKEYKVKIIERNKFMPLWFVLSCSNESKGDALEMANLFYESNLFEASEPEFMLQNMTSSANDTYFNYQWNLAPTNQYGNNNWINTEISRAHGLTTGNSNIVIAIVDHGVELNHPDLNIYGVSYDTENGISPSYVHNDHGTSVAGIVGAKKDNYLGVVGVAPSCPIMSISSPLYENTITTIELADGINFAWQNSASVINCSWYAMEHQLLDDAIEAALTQGRNGLGCVVVCAAGNNDEQLINYPACSNDGIIVVGACSPCGERKNPNSCDGEYWGSNYGEQLDIMAPGVLIPTTDRQGLAGFNPANPLHINNGGNLISNDFSNKDYTVWFSGTSAAAPHVSGVAALLLSLNPNLKGKYVSKLIERAAQKVGGYNYRFSAGKPNGTWCNEMGYGILNAYEVLLPELQSPTVSVVNRNINTSEHYNSSKVYIDNVSVTNNSSLTVNYGSGIIIDGNFSVELGSTLYVY